MQTNHNYTVTYSRKNGQKFRGETIDTIVRNQQGDCLGLLRIIRDITDREENDEKIADLMRQKQLILNSAGEGIYGINKEIQHLLIQKQQKCWDTNRRKLLINP